MKEKVPLRPVQESTVPRVPPIDAARARVAAARQRREALIASGVLPELRPDRPTRFPERIGHYRIKRAVASGGMGTVYEATQERPRRAVAVKVMKHGIASRSALRRFEYEGQILGRLRHPGIAQIFEAGMHVDEEGLLGPVGTSVPFFAMEYIPNARPITRCAAEKKLGTREPLRGDSVRLKPLENTTAPNRAVASRTLPDIDTLTPNGSYGRPFGARSVRSSFPGAHSSGRPPSFQSKLVQEAPSHSSGTTLWLQSSTEPSDTSHSS